jgi:hypothetical protein
MLLSSTAATVGCCCTAAGVLLLLHCCDCTAAAAAAPGSSAAAITAAAVHDYRLHAPTTRLLGSGRSVLVRHLSTAAAIAACTSGRTPWIDSMGLQGRSSSTRV